jgi:hypothetical protein
MASIQSIASSSSASCERLPIELDIVRRAACEDGAEVT